MTKVFCIIPYDKTTRFLNKITNYLELKLSGQVSVFKIRADKKSHLDCLERVKSLDNSTLVIFLGHGRSDRLYGSVADNYDTLASDDFLSENENFNYNQEKFITKDNIDVFNGKKVFCLACNTAQRNGLAQKAVEKGARLFFGFGEIPTSQDEFDDRLSIKDVPSHIICRFKGEVNYIIKHALVYSITNDLTFDEFEKIIRLIANQRAQNILLNHRNLRRRSLLADTIFLFRSQMKIYGDKSIRLIE